MGEAALHPVSTPAHGWLRRAAAALAGAALLTGLVQLPGASAAHAATRATTSAAHTAQPTGSSTALVDVDSLTPSVPSKGDTLKISGTVTNESDETISSAHVGLRVGSGGPMGSRDDISGTAATGDFSVSDGAEIPGHTAALPDIPAGISVPFTIDMPAGDLGLGDDGVYQLGVTASGTTRAEGYQHVLGIKRTFLPWYAHGGNQKTKTTFLWPLIDQPHLDIRSADADQTQTPLFRDDDLASELAPGGRLQQMVELGKDLPVTWVIDPDLLATVDAMTKPYRVLGPGGDTEHTTPGTGTAYAKEWLDELQSAIQGDEVVALPFGDPDLASIAHDGGSVPGTISHLRTATDLADVTVQTILGVTPSTDFAWPVDGAVDPSIVNVATAGGADKILARSDSFHENGSLNYTPTAARPIGGGNTAVVADAALSTAFTGDMTTADGSTLAVQRFLAQSLMIDEQVPGKQRSIVVAPQRMPTASQAQTMAAAISSVFASGWAQSENLSSASAETPDPGAEQAVPSASSYPSALRRTELSTAAFRQIQSIQNQLGGFLVILSRKDRVTTPFGNAVLRSMSTQWRGDAGAPAFRDDISTYLTGLSGDVHILAKQSITLSGRSATIPVTVQNSLAQEVTGLTLRLTSNQSNRLDPGKPQVLDIGAGRSRSLKFTTTASANGKAWVTAQLYTQDGAPYGEKMTFQVNVTSITDTVMLVIAGGLLLLVLAGVRMYRQRKRLAARRAEEGAEGTEADEDPSEAGAQATVAGAEADAGTGADAEARADTEEAGTASETATASEAAPPASEPPVAPEEEDRRDEGSVSAVDDGPEPAEGDADEAAAVPEQPSDPGPDTVAERTEPPAPGEKVDR
nr:DUF6049 family protein [Streptantibioticus parmotrematis]